ncbi:MAG: Addiction module toxin, RelE/StbE family [Parcubacteria group bacterium GW2011_GWB1_49_7]|nr:MAG: Addiction module toxin, RelE/StbE family [Candidatus Pacebacteria bacterium GW2011_GWA1_46_10]KKW09952.1 MAG: Addiction module toxin, RelE/StbE family [Parcubacteria group bacterium GW2011_GWB1_49_7]HCR81003.1 hypothetical protein [Candidatus Paceibacterota bacterium]
MIEVKFTRSFKKRSLKLSRRNQQLQKNLAKQLTLFEQDPFHPSLKTHYLEGKRTHQLSIWIQNNLRALCVKRDDYYIFFDLINHDQYYH